MQITRRQMMAAGLAAPVALLVPAQSVAITPLKDLNLPPRVTIRLAHEIGGSMKRGSRSRVFRVTSTVPDDDALSLSLWFGSDVVALGSTHPYFPQFRAATIYNKPVRPGVWFFKVTYMISRPIPMGEWIHVVGGALESGKTGLENLKYEAGDLGITFDNVVSTA